MLRETVKDIKELREVVKKTLHKSVPVNRKFIEGDHWQGGEGWIGPKPPPEDAESALILQELERAFTSANRIEEICTRHASGVFGREPAWGLVPIVPLKEGEKISPADEAAIDEREAALTRWWNERGVLEKLHDAAFKMCWGERAVLRLYAPTGLRDTLGQAAAGGADQNTLAAIMLRMIYLDVIEPENGAVHVDPTMKRPIGIVTMKNEADEDVTELSYVQEDGTTVVEVVTGDKTEVGEPMQLGGLITMFEMSKSPLVTDQIRQQQRSHNLALSILPRNMTTAGFLERVMLNAQRPGTYDLDEGGNPIPGTFKPAKLTFGAGRVSWIEGIEAVDVTTGKTTTATPDVKFRDPVDPTPTVDACDATYRTILEEAHQAHVLLNTDGDPSGVSRIEARKDFEGSLKLTQPVVQRAGRWVIEACLALTEAIMSSGVSESVTRFRCDFNCRLDVGTITAAEREQNDKSVAAGTLPKEYAIAAQGVDDVDAAMALINSQTGVVLNELKSKAEIVEILTKAGTSIDAAAEVAGFDPKYVAILKRGSTFTGDGAGEDGNPEDDGSDTNPEGEGDDGNAE